MGKKSGPGSKSKALGASAVEATPPSTGPQLPADAPGELLSESLAVARLVTRLEGYEQKLVEYADDDTWAPRERLQAVLGAVRCVSGLLKIVVAHEKLAVALRLDASNRRVEAQLGGQDGGVVRRDSAPPFVVPEGQATH